MIAKRTVRGTRLYSLAGTDATHAIYVRVGHAATERDALSWARGGIDAKVWFTPQAETIRVQLDAA